MINHINDQSPTLTRTPKIIRPTLTKDVAIQVELLSNLQLKEIIAEMDQIHQQEKQALLQQISYLEKKLHQYKGKQLIQSINDIKNIYLNSIELNTSTRIALDQLEQLINDKKDYEVADLKYRLHQAEKVFKLPVAEFKTYPVDKLINSVKKCQQFDINDTNISNLLNELEEADSQWNQIQNDLYEENSTLISSLQMSTQNITYELSLLDCKK